MCANFLGNPLNIEMFQSSGGPTTDNGLTIPRVELLACLKENKLNSDIWECGEIT